ncbi:MAG: peptidylprolyl isomerase [Nannocystaceae bacterium]|nr:peptidylprolyl isomerase [bacterium]
MIRRCLVATLFLGLASGCKEPAPEAAERPSEGRSAAPSNRPEPAASWGRQVPARAPALEALELQRGPESLPVGGDARTAWAQARIGGHAAVDALAGLLEGEAQVTSAHLAALALLDPPFGEPDPQGQTRWAKLEDAVWTRIALTEAPDELEALLLAAARLGGPRTAARLPTLLDGAEDRRGALEAIGILCARSYATTAEGFEQIAKRLEAGEADAQAAAYAVSRCAGPSAELLAGPVRGSLVERLTPALGSADAELVRMAWKALAALGEVPPEIPANILSATPPAWMVEVEAVRALIGHADGRSELVSRLSTQGPDTFAGPRVHVLLVALRGLRDAVVGTPEILRSLSPLRLALKAARDGASGRRRKALALALCESELLAAIGSGDTTALRGCAAGVEALPEGYAQVLEIEALLRVGAAMTREAKAARLLQHANDSRSTVAAAALAALVDVDDPEVSRVLVAGLKRSDVGVRAAAAAALATRASDRARRDEGAVPALEQAASSWPNATMVEARVAAIEALGNLARSASKDERGKPIAPWLKRTILPLAKDPAVAVRRAARAALEPMPELVTSFDVASRGDLGAPFDAGLQRRREAYADATGLRITTSAGVIEIAFEGPAPWNQSAVASLADEGFYDGLTFHRVVPGFVVQGGDPRGDGYGGPGFLLPCEWSNQHYERGVVGMALAGKDTGGSQFFIAQAREPRLDARYTILGRVTEGLDVLDALLPHDVMTKVEVVRGDG